MKVGENPHKVRNIVAAQLPAFRSLYGGLLKSFWKSVHTIGEDGNGVRLMRQDLGVSVRASTAGRLPKGLRDKVLGHYERKWNLEGAIALSKAKSVGNKEKTVEERKEDEGRIDLDQQKLWERIVGDEEFKGIVSKSKSLTLSLSSESVKMIDDRTCRYRSNRCSTNLQSITKRDPIRRYSQITSLRDSKTSKKVLRREIGKQSPSPTPSSSLFDFQSSHLSSLPHRRYLELPSTFLSHQPFSF